MKQLHTPPLGARAIASEGSAGAGTPTLVIVGLGLFIALLDATIVNIALPAMMKDFGIGITQVSWVLNAYNLAFVTLLLTGGKLADQFGRRRMYLLGVLGFVALSVACALAPNAGWLIAFRALQGLAGALLVPATLALVVAAFPRERLGVGIGAWSAIGALASALGPALGGIITQTLSWRWIFWVNLPVGLAALGLAVQFLKESRDPTTESHIDFLGILTISAGLFGLSLALIQAGDWGWRSPRFLSLLIGATLAVIAWIVVESHARMPMVDLGIFHNQTFSAGTSVMFAVGFGMITAIFFVPQFLVNISGFSEVNAGLAITPTPLVVMVVGGFVAVDSTIESARESRRSLESSSQQPVSSPCPR
jgi:EmrB/QacA subfamily drug resistance transporter